ncbi:MAG: uncharacterized protein JWP61_1402 [Friedmanniella sp.]|nr:uncharacterized protein [Friedmanniella sp.]
MRCYDEPIEVRHGLVAGQEAPHQFVWRDRLWLVTDVQTRWVESGAWWEGPAARELRGESRTADATGPPATTPWTALAEEPDLLAEKEVWRVLAAPGASSQPGVYELAHAAGTGEWRLRRVVD